jgi:HK97 family phage major capsid protein
MGIKSNHRLLSDMTPVQKAQFLLTDISTPKGLLQPAQADKFIRLLVKEAVVMQNASVQPIANPRQEVSKIRFNQRVLRAGNEFQALAQNDQSKPNTSGIEFDVKLFKAEVPMSYELLEDNIERDQLRDTVMQAVGEAVSRDMDEIAISGDTTSADIFLAKLEGVLVQSNTNVTNSNSTAISPTLLTSVLKTMPDEFATRKQNMAYMTAVDAEIDYRNTLSQRATVVGDRYLTESTPILHHGIPIVPVPMFPTNLGGGTETNILLSDWGNIAIGIYREIMMRTWEDPREGGIYILIRIRFDVKLIEASATAKAINVAV